LEYLYQEHTFVMDLKLNKTMKKIFLTTAIAALFTANVFAFNGVTKNEDEGAANVSYSVINKFKADFSGAKNVTWVVTSNTQKAEFTVEDVKMTAFYDLRGEFLGVTQYVDYKTIPSKAKEEIASKYKNYNVKNVIKFDTNSADPNIEATVYFVDLKSASEELLVRVTPSAGVYFFQQVK
jgi:hypothetical protein